MPPKRQLDEAHEGGPKKRQKEHEAPPSYTETVPFELRLPHQTGGAVRRRVTTKTTTTVRQKRKRGPDKSPRVPPGTLAKVSAEDLRRYRSQRRAAARRATSGAQFADATQSKIGTAYLAVIRLLAPYLLKPESEPLTIGEVLINQPDTGNIGWNSAKLTPSTQVIANPYSASGSAGAKQLPATVLQEAQDILRRAYQVTMPATYLLGEEFRRAMANPFKVATENIASLTSGVTNPFNSMFSQETRSAQTAQKEEQLITEIKNRGAAAAEAKARDISTSRALGKETAAKLDALDAEIEGEYRILARQRQINAINNDTRRAGAGTVGTAVTNISTFGTDLRDDPSLLWAINPANQPSPGFVAAVNALRTLDGFNDPAELNKQIDGYIKQYITPVMNSGEFDDIMDSNYTYLQRILQRNSPKFQWYGSETLEKNRISETQDRIKQLQQQKTEAMDFLRSRGVFPNKVGPYGYTINTDDIQVPRDVPTAQLIDVSIPTVRPGNVGGAPGRQPGDVSSTGSVQGNPIVPRLVEPSPFDPPLRAQRPNTGQGNPEAGEPNIPSAAQNMSLGSAAGSAARMNRRIVPTPSADRESGNASAAPQLGNAGVINAASSGAPGAAADARGSIASQSQREQPLDAVPPAELYQPIKYNRLFSPDLRAIIFGSDNFLPRPSAALQEFQDTLRRFTGGLGGSTNAAEKLEEVARALKAFARYFLPDSFSNNAGLVRNVRFLLNELANFYYKAYGSRNFHEYYKADFDRIENSWADGSQFMNTIRQLPELRVLNGPSAPGTGVPSIASSEGVSESAGEVAASIRDMAAQNVEERRSEASSSPSWPSISTQPSMSSSSSMPSPPVSPFPLPPAASPEYLKEGLAALNAFKEVQRKFTDNISSLVDEFLNKRFDAQTLTIMLGNELSHVDENELNALTKRFEPLFREVRMNGQDEAFRRSMMDEAREILGSVMEYAEKVRVMIRRIEDSTRAGQTDEQIRNAIKEGVREGDPSVIDYRNAPKMSIGEEPPPLPPDIQPEPQRLIEDAEQPVESTPVEQIPSASEPMSMATEYSPNIRLGAPGSPATAQLGLRPVPPTQPREERGVTVIPDYMRRGRRLSFGASPAASPVIASEATPQQEELIAQASPAPAPAQFTPSIMVGQRRRPGITPRRRVTFGPVTPRASVMPTLEEEEEQLESAAEAFATAPSTPNFVTAPNTPSTPAAAAAAGEESPQIPTTAETLGASQFDPETPVPERSRLQKFADEFRAGLSGAADPVLVQAMEVVANRMADVNETIGAARNGIKAASNDNALVKAFRASGNTAGGQLTDQVAADTSSRYYQEAFVGQGTGMVTRRKVIYKQFYKTLWIIGFAEPVTKQPEQVQKFFNTLEQARLQIDNLAQACENAQGAPNLPSLGAALRAVSASLLNRIAIGQTKLRGVISPVRGTSTDAAMTVAANAMAARDIMRNVVQQGGSFDQSERRMYGSGAMYGGAIRRLAAQNAMLKAALAREKAAHDLDALPDQVRLHINGAIEAKQRGGSMGDIVYKGLMAKAAELGAPQSALALVHNKLHPYSHQQGRGLLGGIGKFFGLTKLGSPFSYGSGQFGGGRLPEGAVPMLDDEYSMYVEPPRMFPVTEPPREGNEKYYPLPPDYDGTWSEFQDHVRKYILPMGCQSYCQDQGQIGRGMCKCGESCNCAKQMGRGMYGGSMFDNPYQQGSGMIPIPGGDEILGALTDPEGTVQTLASIGEGMFGRSSEPNFGNAQSASQEEAMGRKDTLEDLIKWRQGTAFKRDAQLELAFMQEYGDQNLPATTPMPSDFPQKAASWGVDRDLGGMNDFWREQLGRQIKFQANWPKAYAQLRALKSPEEQTPEQQAEFYQQYPTLESLGEDAPASYTPPPQTDLTRANRIIMRNTQPMQTSIFSRPGAR